MPDHLVLSGTFQELPSHFTTFTGGNLPPSSLTPHLFSLTWELEAREKRDLLPFPNSSLHARGAQRALGPASRWAVMGPYLSQQKLAKDGSFSPLVCEALERIELSTSTRWRRFSLGTTACCPESVTEKNIFLHRQWLLVFVTYPVNNQSCLMLKLVSVVSPQMFTLKL